MTTSISTLDRRLRRRSALAALLPSLVLLAALVAPALGAGPSSAAGRAVRTHLTTPGLTIRASALHIPARIAAGLLALTLVNDTRAPASLDIGRANPGATEAAIKAADATSDTLQGFLRLLHLVTFVGGPDAVPPGARETAILDLRTPGHYGLHLSVGNDQGHTITFRVTAGLGLGATPPADALPVLLKDMKFVGLPRTLAAGTTTFKLTSLGPSVHEMDLARLDPGKTMQDVANLFKGPQQGPGGPPPWAHVVGGLNMIAAHQTAYVTITLTPGTYVALCTMPDMRSGKMQGAPHAAEGMLATFTVS